MDDIATAAPTQPKVADFGSRFSAFMIDAALLFAAQWVTFIVLSRQLQAVGMTTRTECAEASGLICEGPSSALWALLLALLFASTVGYSAFFEGVLGATPGKRWMGLEVIGTDGARPIGLTRGALRSVVRQAFWLSLFFLLEASPLALPVPAVLFILIPTLAIVALALGAISGQAAHDHAAATLVVRTSDLPAVSAAIVSPSAADSAGDAITPAVLPIVEEPVPDSEERP